MSSSTKGALYFGSIGERAIGRMLLPNAQ